MLTGKLTPATKKGRLSAATLGILLCASTHATPVTGANSADALPADGPRYGNFREARNGTSGPVQRTVNFKEIPRPSDGLVHFAFDGEAPQPAIVARMHYAFVRDLGLSSDGASQGESEVLLRNSDALVRAKARLTLSKKWLGFVYADMGAADSAIKWQGVAGIRDDHGVHVLGGWRHVTYHFSPSSGLDSLDFNGPFLGATLTW